MRVAGGLGMLAARFGRDWQAGGQEARVNGEEFRGGFEYPYGRKHGQRNFMPDSINHLGLRQKFEEPSTVHRCIES